jgi:hypothetical protein
MANLTRASTVNYDGSNPSLPKISGPVAGEAIAKGDWVYMKSDGKWWIATGAAANAAAKAKGMAMAAASANEAVSVAGPGWRWQYATGLTIGAQYFLGTAGLLADAATTGGDTVLAYAVSATDIVVTGVQN